MAGIIQQWIKKQFSDPEAVGLLVLIVLVFIALMTLGTILAPVITAVIIAYLLNGFVHILDRAKIPHVLSTSLVCIFFVGILYASLFILLPMIWEQLSALITEFPKLFSKFNEFIVVLHQKYPDYVSAEQLKTVILSFKSELASVGQYALSISISSLSHVAVLVIYLILVPLMVFFMLKDTTVITSWFTQFLPQRRKLISQVWDDVQLKIGKYIRAKVVEIVLVSAVSSLAFAILGLNYFILLGVLVGVSVLIPFVGVAVVTIPVIVVAYMQWGWTSHFAYLCAVYATIVVLDAHVLATLLFSEAVKLHPVAVIIAILFFGSIWGFLGIFFAIPLATIIKAILDAWPGLSKEK